VCRTYALCTGHKAVVPAEPEDFSSGSARPAVAAGRRTSSYPPTRATTRAPNTRTCEACPSRSSGMTGPTTYRRTRCSRAHERALCRPAVHALGARDGRPEPFRQGDPLRRAPLLASYATFVSYVQRYFFLVSLPTDRFAYVEIHATRTRSSMGKSTGGRGWTSGTSTWCAGTYRLPRRQAGLVPRGRVCTSGRARYVEIDINAYIHNSTACISTSSTSHGSARTPSAASRTACKPLKGSARSVLTSSPSASSSSAHRSARRTICTPRKRGTRKRARRRYE
jgi:hypothetical protein